MNFEQLFKQIKYNNSKLKNKEKTKIFIKNIVRILKKNRKRLKLGKILFEFKKIIYGEIVVYEEVDIRFIRQDTTLDDELNIENRLKALNWQWDFKNVGAFIIVFSLILIFFYSQIYLWYCNNLPTIAFRDSNYNKLIYFSLESSFGSFFTESFKSLTVLNFQFVNFLTEFSIKFNILF